MPIAKIDLLNVREQIQEDLDCILDGFDNDIVIRAQQAVVDNFKKILDKLKESQ